MYHENVIADLPTIDFAMLGLEFETAKNASKILAVLGHNNEVNVSMK